jgi:hypothetical protein
MYLKITNIILIIILIIVILYWNYKSSLFINNELTDNEEGFDNLNTENTYTKSNSEEDTLFQNEQQLMGQQTNYYEYRQQTGSGTLLGTDNDPQIDRDNNPLLDTTDVDKFLSIDTTKPEGKQLVEVNPDAKKPPMSDVDIEVAKCRKIKSCAELDGTQCGYCFTDKKFHYGNKDGPYTSVCQGQGMWVTTNADCVKTRERSICESITSCNEMVGEASICGWCPTKNKAMVAKSVSTGDGSGATKLVPKYPDEDQCLDPDTFTNQDLGLVSQGQCTEFGEKHPCIGPNENTGPHSMACLQKLWSAAGGTSKGTFAPQNNPIVTDMLNKKGWKDVFDDMKSWVADANSNDWDSVKTHYKGVYGTDPDPCDSRYKSVPLECYQKLTVDAGCSTQGKFYPSQENVNSWPSKLISAQWAQWVKSGIYPKSSYSNAVSIYKTQAQDSSLDYNKRDYAYELCYGGQLTAPPPIKVGDEVSYTFSYPAWGGNTTIKGYVCEITGSGENATAEVYWEQVQNQDGTQSVTRSAHLDNPKIGNDWLGSYCGQAPEMFGNAVPAKINIGDLSLLSSCKADTSCPDSGCSMQNIVYVYYPGSPGVEYSVSKSQINSVMQRLRGIYSNATLCSKADIQYLVDSGLPYCACGWILSETGSYTSVYPSTIGTSGGCGGGSQNVISCGDNGPSWSNGLAGIYVRITAKPDEIMDKLKAGGFGGAVVATVGKNEFIPLTGVGSSS